ncbi:hypothetical protein [Terriglobus sp. TAA 43]|uniref:hypothetical protein n=1 Tax=Terriglobus sp. TAA 43 TaxID=278961 RepID=UPI0006486F6C|nr:hypothetical protein [Terriglobus sp. TAA 43]
MNLHPRVLTSTLLAVAMSSGMHAQNKAVVSVATAPAAATNPTFLFRSLSISNEWDGVHAASDTNTTTLSYTEPFRHAANSLGVSIPLATTSDSASTSEPPSHPFVASTASTIDKPSVVLGDISVSGQWIPWLTRHNGVLLTTTVGAPTSQDSSVGKGKWVVTPSVAVSHFWGPHFLLAQFFQQKVSLTGPASRPDVNRSDLDLYMSASPHSLRWWMTADLNLGIDQANHNHTPSSVTASVGRGLRKTRGGSLNGSVMVGAGIGAYRPYDVVVTAGISLVGFQWKQR